jgi:DNA polymerase III delta prime subunit
VPVDTSLKKKDIWKNESILWRLIVMNNPGEIAQKLVSSISQVLIGKEAQIKQVVVALLARGHVLIEDVPGVGKTLLALATARSMGVRFKRVHPERCGSPAIRCITASHAPSWIIA